MVGVAGGGVGVTGVWVMRLCYTRSVCEVAVPERVQLLRVDGLIKEGTWWSLEGGSGGGEG